MINSWLIGAVQSIVFVNFLVLDNDLLLNYCCYLVLLDEISFVFVKSFSPHQNQENNCSQTGGLLQQ
jgi:hypothetical protein